MVNSLFESIIRESFDDDYADFLAKKILMTELIKG